MPRDLLKAPLRHILLTKGHSAGVGDILRSSAAWRALIDAVQARHGHTPDLHVVMFSREPGYASDGLMAEHHLLASYTVVPKTGQGLAAWRGAVDTLTGIARRAQADLIIDCEPHGMRSTTLAWAAARRLGIPTLGVAEFPARGWFYSVAAPSTRAYRERMGLPDPMDYTDRDFVVLAGLGIPRAGRPIELRATPAAQALQAGLRARLGLPEGAPLLGLNIGCGTPDAKPKRPDLALLSSLVAGLESPPDGPAPAALVLTGAPFEADVNQAFMAIHRARSRVPMIDLAGQTKLVELPGLIQACRLYLSTDSGPFHMAVGLEVPTLAIFNRPAREHEHHHPWVRCVQLVSEADRDAALANGLALWAAGPS